MWPQSAAQCWLTAGWHQEMSYHFSSWWDAVPGSQAGGKPSPCGPRVLPETGVPVLQRGWAPAAHRPREGTSVPQTRWAAHRTHLLPTSPWPELAAPIPRRRCELIRPQRTRRSGQHRAGPWRQGSQVQMSPGPTHHPQGTGSEAGRVLGSGAKAVRGGQPWMSGRLPHDPESPARLGQPPPTARAEAWDPEGPPCSRWDSAAVSSQQSPTNPTRTELPGDPRPSQRKAGSTPQGRGR